MDRIRTSILSGISPALYQLSCACFFQTQSKKMPVYQPIENWLYKQKRKRPTQPRLYSKRLISKSLIPACHQAYQLPAYHYDFDGSRDPGFVKSHVARFIAGEVAAAAPIKRLLREPRMAPGAQAHASRQASSQQAPRSLVVKASRS